MTILSTIVDLFSLTSSCRTVASRAALVLICVTLFGCSGAVSESGGADFRHEITDTARPWTHDRFDTDQNKFTFAVFSDLTGGERPRIFEIAVAQLNLLRPELTINVGDLIEGASDNPAELAKEWDWFDERAGRAKGPVFYVGGNHDLTGEVLQQVWDDRYGRRYYHFVYRDVLFLVLDTEDNTPERAQEIFRIRTEGMRIYKEQGLDTYNQSEYHRLPERIFGNVTPEQSDYFRQAIADNEDVRWTFLFMHKAAWENEAHQNFAAIEDALSERPYTVFHGHMHAYKYEQRHGRDYIQLATTGGTQFPNEVLSADQVVLVTVSDEGVDIAYLLMSGILDKTGHIPLDGDDLCFRKGFCGEEE